MKKTINLVKSTRGEINKMQVAMIGLFLSEREAKDLIDRHFKKQYEAYERHAKDPCLSKFLKDFRILKSKGAGVFEIKTFTAKDLTGMQFVPVTARDLRDIRDITNGAAMFIKADLQFDGPCDITDGVYGETDDLFDEMEDKLKRYLPDDFEWATHIGVLTGETNRKETNMEKETPKKELPHNKKALENLLFEVEKESNFTVTTSLRGCKVKISEANDPDYPGILIEFLPEGYYNLPEEKRGEPASVLIEWPKGGKYPRAVVWADAESEDYTHLIPLPNYNGERK